MTNLTLEYKSWITHVQSADLEKINVSRIQNANKDAEVNKTLFKILLYLSHCADKCSKEKLSKHKDLYKIADAICKNLISIPSCDKYYSALYFIIVYLVQGKYYLEAKRLTEYLFPGKMFEIEEPSKVSSKYYSLGNIWQTELNKQLDALLPDLATRKATFDKQFINNLKFHLKILDYCREEDTYTFITADTYMRKLCKMPLDVGFPCINAIFEHLSGYIKNLKKLSITEAYDTLIPIIGFAFLKRNDAKNNPAIMNYFVECDDLFLSSFASVPQCNDCYQLVKLHCINLFATNFMSSDIGKTRFQKTVDTLERLLSKYGPTNNSLLQTLAVISWSFDTLFGNWEQMVPSKIANTKITFDEIVEMGDFVSTVHKALINRKYPSHYVCKQCSESGLKCRVKNEIYHTSVATSTYIRVLTRMNQDTLSEKLFTKAKELLELLVSSFNQLKAHGCKCSSLMWDVCGRLIFNMGLISESKYAARLEGLYEILCSQIVEHDGMEAVTSSFGLENPVGTSLHRLCNVYYNQEKYRQAMTFAAYNALLSKFENRKKKACDMWSNIKLKTKDSSEMGNLTMVECLQKDAKVVAKFGIVVNLEDYDLNDLCLKELKSLLFIKSDILSAMKRTLDLLESRDSVLEYAQGTLLLSLHAMQLHKREYISDYISRAMERLKKLKQKSASIQCLMANLRFFGIIEKLYARSQLVDKQMEDANFTIKAFKTIKGSRAEEDVDDSEEIIVPTYGGINIEEDNKLSGELRDVLNLWESCMTKDVGTIACGWEPKFTLETIVFCGEYCRLYKFSVIEEKSWKVAHKLATAMKDYTNCIYVTSRCLSLKYIDDEWIANARKYAEDIEITNKTGTDMDVVTLFWLSLADFYLDCRMVSEAKVLLDKLDAIPNLNLLSNVKLYVYLIGIKFRNYFAINSEASQEGYVQLLVEIHYLLINSYEMVAEGVVRLWNIRYQLIACEQMFECLCDLTVPMYSLLSYRDVALHLSQTLKIAQKMGMSLRIAEIIKYLCYVDLLRLRVDSCETHLQDLEHVLCLDHFQTSSKSKLMQKTVQSLNELTLTDKLRDASKVEPVGLPKNSASPELKKKLFSPPSILEHTHYCQCFYCTNLHYQYLVFSCCHVQAQLYSVLKYVREAENYFYGACKVKLKIDERDGDEARHCKYNRYQWKRSQNYTVDYLMYLLDYSLFIDEFAPDQKDNFLGLIEEVQRIAAETDLSKHALSTYAVELYGQYHMYNTLSGKLDISVPHDITIDITNQQLDNCITPKVQVEKTTCNSRRHKSPPAVALPSIVTSSDKRDSKDDRGNSPMPKKSSKLNSATAVVPETGARPKRTSTRNVRRKILVDEVDESPAAVEESEKTQPKVARTRRGPRNLIGEKLDAEKERDESKVAPKRSTRLAKKLNV